MMISFAVEFFKNNNVLSLSHIQRIKIERLLQCMKSTFLNNSKTLSKITIT